VRDDCAARGLDALVVTSLPNILYLTNFTGSSAIAVLTPDGVHFITDFRYVTALADSQRTPFACPELELVTVNTSYDAALVSVVEKSPASSRIGFEAAHLTVARHSWLGDRLEHDTHPLIPTEGLIERTRAVKDEYELQTLRTAASMLSSVVTDICREARAGRREREVASAIDSLMRRAGFERNAFDTIVASGPQGALPHAHPGERILSEGDLVVLDFGGVYDSYCVDLTRTVSVGPISARGREVYDAVRRAHDLAIEAVRPGASKYAVDAAARDELTRRGLGEAFGHGTGHGLGIEVHEAPRISRKRAGIDVDDDPLVSGMVFTIEPGAYLPGWGGVRIEDDVVVTEDGVEVLTTAATDLMEV
jgi:Xaa-Pro aminopeptidase